MMAAPRLQLTPRHAYLLVMAVTVIGSVLLPIATIQPAASWTIYPSFPFRATATGGPISFASATSIYGWGWASNRVKFTTVGPYSYLAFSCSDNAAMVITRINDEQIDYTVSAAVLETSTTTVELPAGGKVYKVTGADSWTWAAPVVTVKVLHASSESIVVYVNPVSSPFFTFKLMWSQMFLLVAIMWMIVEMNSASQGESAGSWARVIGWAILSAAIYALLTVVEDLV